VLGRTPRRGWVLSAKYLKLALFLLNRYAVNREKTIFSLLAGEHRRRRPLSQRLVRPLTVVDRAEHVEETG
jgi:hypothetical protein